MSRNTEPRRMRRRASAVLLAFLVAVPTALVATAPAYAAPSWTVSGEISPWDGSLDGTVVTIVHDDGADGTEVEDIVVGPGPSFSSSALDSSSWGPGDYTLYFDVPDASEFVDGYLGEALDDEFADALFFPGDADIDLGAVSPIPAQYIDGTVRSSGAPLPGADVMAYAEEVWLSSVWSPVPFTTVSLADGSYSLKVAAGRNYVVRAFANGYAGETWQDHPACGCDFDLVASARPPAGPTTGVDFDLALEDTYLFGLAFDGDPLTTGVPISGVDAHIYVPVSGGWKEVAVARQGVSVPYWEQSMAVAGAFRLRFSYQGVWLHISGQGQETFDLSSGPSFSFDTDPADACYLDTPQVASGDGYLGVVVVDDPSVVPGCGPEPVPSSGSGGSSGSPRPRPAVSTGTGAQPAATPTPSATPTPTPSATPRPTASPTPEATAPAEPAPASAPDLWWLLWIGLGLLVVVVVGGVVFFQRRT